MYLSDHALVQYKHLYSINTCTVYNSTFNPQESRKFKTTEGNDGYAVPDEMLPLQRLTFKSTEILDFGRQIATGMDWIGSKGVSFQTHLAPGPSNANVFHITYNHKKSLIVLIS